MPTQDEQDYADYLDYQKHIAGQQAAPQEPSLQGGSVRSLADLVMPGFNKGVAHGAESAATLGNVNTSDPSDSPTGRAVGKYGTQGAMAVGTGGAVGAVPSVAGRIGASALANGAMGAATKPEGEDSLGARAEQGAVGAGLGTLLQGAGEGIGALLKKGAGIVQNIRDVKSGAMAGRASSAIDDAAQAISDKQISPKADKLKELLQGKQFDINPDRVKPTFPRLGEAMESNLPTQNVPVGDGMGTVAEAPAASRVPISGSRALRLKQAADSAANWGKSQPFNSEATASVPEAEGLANILRRQINSDPAAAELNSGMEKAMDLRSALTSREGTSPIETLLSKPGTSRGSIVDLADTAAGSNLRGMGKDITTAKNLLLDGKNLIPHSLPDAAAVLPKIAGRGAVEAASLADALKNKSPVSKEAIINALAQEPNR
jgi:hypothetical protein